MLELWILRCRSDSVKNLLAHSDLTDHISENVDFSHADWTCARVYMFS